MLELDKLSAILQKIGFNDKEARVYLTSLELGEALPSAISRRSEIKRSTTYLILEKLGKKGLVTQVKRGGVLFFKATKPEFLIENRRQEYEELKCSLNELETILPALTQLHSSTIVTPQMSVYRGKSGLIQIMEDTLTSKTELLCWCDVNLAVNSVLHEYYPKYISKKVKRKLWLRGIFSDNDMGMKFRDNEKKELRKVYLIPKEKFPFENEINIYDDKISIISHQDQIGVIIQNEHIANTQRSIFNLAFEYAKTLNIYG